MEETHAALMQMLSSLYDREASPKAKKNYLTRNLECTPYTGNYGTRSGWVICVSGSPPKGTIFLADFGPTPIYMSGSGARVKRISGERQLDIIKAFHRKHLRNADKPVVLDGDSK